MIPTMVIDEERAQQTSAGAHLRVRRWFVAVGMIADAVLIARRRWPAAAGFGIGAVVANWGMLYLQKTTASLAAQAAGETAAGIGKRVTPRILLRYAVIAVIAYGIFVSSRPAFFGFMGGLFVPVAAMVCEAAYEGWLALRGKL